MLALLPLLAAGASVAGLYQVHQMEIGGALELRKDGHFRYALDYGAVSEQAKGQWIFDGKTLRLTTSPAPKPAAFELIRDDPAPSGELVIALEPPGFGENCRIDAIATDAASGRRGLVTSDDHGRIDSAGHNASSIDPLVPVYEMPAGHFALNPATGHHLLFRFHANDLGTAAFKAEPLPLTDHAFVLTRYGTRIRFMRVQD